MYNVYCGKMSEKNMKKIMKIILCISFVLFIISFLSGMVMEILRYIPFPKNDTFDLFWNIFFYSTYVFAIPLIIGIIYIVKK